MNQDELTGIERAHLHALLNTEGFKVFKQLMEEEVQKFHVKLINTDAANSSAIIAAHQMAKAASQFYVGLINRLNREVEVYLEGRKGNVQQDVTEVLDMGSDETMEQLLNNIPEEELR